MERIMDLLTQYNLNEYYTHLMIIPVIAVLVITVCVYKFCFKKTKKTRNQNKKQKNVEKVNPSSVTSEQKPAKKEKKSSSVVSSNVKIAPKKSAPIKESIKKMDENKKTFEVAKSKKPEVKVQKQKVPKSNTPPKQQTKAVIDKPSKKQKSLDVKPADYDEGKWQTVPSKTDKQKKKTEEVVLIPGYTKPKKSAKKTEKKQLAEKENKPVESKKQNISKDLKSSPNQKKKIVDIKADINEELFARVDTIETTNAKPLVEKEQKELRPPLVPTTLNDAGNDSNIINDNPKNVVFDEIGEQWTEAPKKTKKKARKD